MILLKKNKDGLFRKVVTKTGLEKISLNSEEVLFASSKLVLIDGVNTPVQPLGDIWTDIGINNLHNEGGVEFNNGKKPIKLINRIIKLICKQDENSIVLDFFAGSGTTAQAVLEINVEDQLNYQFICIQYPESIENSEVNSNEKSYTIADLTFERIKKTLIKLKAKYPEKTTNLSCAHYALAPSNYKFWRSDINNETALREQLNLFKNTENQSLHEKAINKQRAMLTELCLKYGLGVLGVHANSHTESIAGVAVHLVQLTDDRELWVCFEPYNQELKAQIVNRKPAQVLMLNSCFAGNKADEDLANLHLELDAIQINLTVI